MKFNSKIVKEYPKKGIYTQYRFEKVVTFNCYKCKKDKTAKLVSTINDKLDQIICNGCYGELIKE